MAFAESATLDAQTNGMSSPKPVGEGALFRLAMREFASGVALVTTGEGDRRSGCTANSLCSLSLEPPSLILCLSRGSSTLAALRANKSFGVSLLAGGQQDLANRFAGRTGVKGAARFAGADWMTLATGAPLLRNALAVIDCTLEETLERHTHAIVIGRVAAVRHGDGETALLHWRSRFESHPQS